MLQLVSGHRESGHRESGDAEFRQLRHHTRNALARILAQVSTGLSRSARSRTMMADVERRILLTAEIADALFGLTRAPGPFADRLSSLCNAVAELIGEDDQILTVTVRVAGLVPEPHRETMLRVANEFVGNAVKHGMLMRLIGRIEVSARADETGTVLEIVDDGWGCSARPVPGEGMGVARALAEAMGGWIDLERRVDRTIARLVLPPVRHDA